MTVVKKGYTNRDVTVDVPKQAEQLSKFITFNDRKSGEKYELTNKGVIINEKLANFFDVKSGDDLTIRDADNKDVTVKIHAVVENYAMHFIYMTPSYYDQLFNKQPVYNVELLKFSNKLTDKQQDKLADKLLKSNYAANVSFTSQIGKTMDDTMSSLNIVVWVLIISAALLAGKKIPICCEKELPEILPEGLYCCEDFAEEPARPGIYIGIKRCGEKGVLSLIPKAVTVGIGCRRGTDKEKINRCVYEACKEADIDKKAISRVASIDLKAREQGILEWCRESGIPFAVYPAEVLNDVEGSFTSSAFVKETTGVDNVCERSALLASDGGKLIQRKTAVDGVTAALAVREWRIHFA